MMHVMVWSGQLLQEVMTGSQNSAAEGRVCEASVLIALTSAYIGPHLVLYNLIVNNFINLLFTSCN